jgi:hypothetical protein
MNGEINDLADTNDCQISHIDLEAGTATSLRVSEPLDPETDQWCDSQETPSIENRFCSKWTKYARKQTKFLAANLEFVRTTKINIYQLLHCAEAVQENIANDMDITEARSSVANCMKIARKTRRKEKRLMRKLRSIKRFCRHALKAFGKSYKKLKGSGPPKPPNQSGARILLKMTVDEAQRYVDSHNVIGKNGKVKMVRVVISDGKSLPVTKELRRDRVNVEVENNIIIRIVSFG